ncbi:MAG: T9SS type A sorting domain-containing protein [Gammaproteobacteria bacterium]|nr:T9SS type A sorting domain-containing protein [Gammaproteobacteria bacterium]NIW46443.1 T9SS type A sorting domain-containing protein [Gammaproteobacteria bacterium]NIX55720.1 T9SS type A sorting domain-containing protein [candidate division Zixibacteria bacterium]
MATIPGGNNGHMTYANGRLYVVARCANQVYEVTLDGQISLLAGSGARGNDDGPALQATFSLPNGIAPSPDGDTLYINDDVNLTGTCQNTPLNPVLVRMIVDVTTSIEGPDEPASPIQKQFALYQNYPNPFNPSTQIQYFLPVASHVTITIYDVLGKRINALVNERQTAGTKTVAWSGRDESNALAPSGVYIYRLKAGSFVKSHKMLLIR